MRIQVKLYASLARLHPTVRAGEPVEVHLLAGATVGDALAQLALPSELVKVVFVNGRVRATCWLLQEDDQVGVFPPVGGG
jgi:sulfur-carrier protein